MSAYIVSDDHLAYLVKASISRRLSEIDGGSIHWRNGSLLQTMRCTAKEKELIAVSQMLLDENAKSVNSRYKKQEEHTFDSRSLRKQWEIEPAQVLKSCDCYEYQACEHEEWENSEAKNFIDSLRAKAWSSVDGYKEAKWGVPLTEEEKRAGYHAMLELLKTEAKGE